MQRKVSRPPSDPQKRLRVIAGRRAEPVAPGLREQPAEPGPASDDTPDFIRRAKQARSAFPSQPEPAPPPEPSPPGAGPTETKPAEPRPTERRPAAGRPFLAEPRSGPDWSGRKSALAAGLLVGLLLGLGLAGLAGLVPFPDGRDDREAPLPEAAEAGGALDWTPAPLLEPDEDAGIVLPASSGSADPRAPILRAVDSPHRPDRPPLPDARAEVNLDEIAAVEPTSAAVADPPPRVALHLSANLSDSARRATEDSLRAEGFDLDESRVAALPVRESQVFFFHEEDEADAARIAERIGARLRDFTDFRPAPEPGRIEVWLAAAD